MDSRLETRYEISRYFRSNAGGLHRSPNIHMRYRNEAGNISERTVSPRSYFCARDGREFLKAWCHLRQGERTFRVDRIVWIRTGDPNIVSAAQPMRTYYPPAMHRSSTPSRNTVPRPVRQLPAAPRLPSSITPRPRKKNRHILLKIACAIFAIVLTPRVFVERSSKFYSTPSRAHFIASRIIADRRTPPVSRLPTGAAASSQANSTSSRTLYERTIDAAITKLEQTTGITDDNVVDSFVAADADKSSSLSWAEIGAFQRRLRRDYTYMENETALRPDQFIAAGGGDCEDWSLVTAELLRFWRHEAYIGSIRSPDDRRGHAVCLVRVSQKPPRYMYYRFTESGSFGGSHIKAGYYIPIDYEQVGALTNAVEPGWELRHIYMPESIYGLAM